MTKQTINNTRFMGLGRKLTRSVKRVCPWCGGGNPHKSKTHCTRDCAEKAAYARGTCLGTSSQQRAYKRTLGRLAFGPIQSVSGSHE